MLVSKRAVSVHLFVLFCHFLSLSSFLSFLPPQRVLSLLQLTMASSSSVQRGAVRAPPPPDQLAAFHKTVDKRVMTGVLCREARDAELSAQAAVQAEALFGDDSLVVARLRYFESDSLASLAREASGVEQETLLSRSWAVLLSVISLLQRRLADKTVLPGTVRKEELEYDAHSQAALCKAKNEPAPSSDELRSWASTLGYETLIFAMRRSLDLLPQPYWPTVQKRMVESFVLQGLDVIPRTAGIRAGMMNGEDDLVAIIKEYTAQLRFRFLHRRSSQVAVECCQ